MTDKVVRQRMGRESVAHNIARRERAAEATIPRRGRSKGKNVVGSSSEAQHEPAYEPRHHNHDEDEDATEIAPEVECGVINPKHNPHSLSFSSFFHRQHYSPPKQK